MKNTFPTAAIIVIGNEVLSGRTPDQNIPFLTQRLNHLGIQVVEIHIIKDREEAIIKTVLAAHAQFSYVFTTGGIGATHDDITTASIAKAFECPLQPHPEAIQMLEFYYGPKALDETRLRMSLIPKGALLIKNPVSGAPGYYIKNVYVMAGVPSIMQAMFDNIAQTLVEGPPIYSQTIQCQLGENTLAEKLAEIQSRYSALEVGSYPYFSKAGYGVSLVVRGREPAEVARCSQEIQALVLEKGGEPILT